MRAARMTPYELKEYSNSLVAQANGFRKSLIEIAVFSEGAVTFADVMMMPLSQIRDLEEIVTKKIKLDKNIKSKEML